MGRFEVDTGSLAAGGAGMAEVATQLTSARAAIGEVQAAAGAAGEPSVDAAIETFAQEWGVMVAALQEAAVGLGRGAGLAAAAYDQTERSAIGP